VAVAVLRHYIDYYPRCPKDDGDKIKLLREASDGFAPMIPEADDRLRRLLELADSIRQSFWTHTEGRR
jgi:hypothetical protein